MSSRIILVALLLTVPALVGCADIKDLFGSIGAPDADVYITPLEEGGAWNTESEFTAQVVFDEPLPVRIEATGEDGTTLEASATAAEAEVQEDGTYSTEVSLELPDGVWEIVLYVDEHRWTTFEEVAIDATAPEVHGLELQGIASDGTYTLGAGATVDPDGSVRVLAQPGATQVATGLPYTVTGLDKGIHLFDVVVEDEAGNQNIYTVQVSAGGAEALPEGTYTAGIVARYDNELRIWDITDLGAYADIGAAQAAEPDFLGSGYKVDPDDPQVQDVVDQVVAPGNNTAETALALYRWMYNALEYDVDRLQSNDLLAPGETIDNGGGVCRDLAALYTSLLRAAGVPARLVTGYLGGEVNGFHAWVEFYGGPVAGNPSPWVVVDVSGIGLSDQTGDDRYSDQSMLQSFAIQRPDYLTLRTISPAAEVDGWSSAVSVGYREGGDVEFAKHLPDDQQSTVGGSLCLDPDSYAREIVAYSPNGAHCDASTPYYFPNPYPWRIQEVLDYGLIVHDDAGGDVELTLAYPVEADQPGSVEFTVYGPSYRDEDRDTTLAKVTLVF